MRVRFEHLTYQHPRADEPVLRNVNLELEPGEPVFIGGPPGVGKSTLAMLLAGVEEPNSGETSPPVPKLRRNSLLLSLLEASPADLTLHEYFRYLASSLGAGTGSAERFREELDELGLEPERSTARLGSGEFRLALLAGAKALSPGLVVVDDLLRPFTGGQREAAIALAREIGREEIFVGLDVPPDDESFLEPFDLHQLSGGSLLPWGVHRTPALLVKLVLSGWEDNLAVRLRNIEELEVEREERPLLVLKAHREEALAEALSRLAESDVRIRELHSLNR